jgi:hypothetical protein
MRRLSYAAVIASLLFSVLSGSLAGQGTIRQWSKFNLQSKEITESSGICASRRNDGIYYTHNDSGDTARFFKFDRKGQILATYNVTNANKAIDWEDIASATIAGKPYIFCGDIGDNKSKRTEIYVYRIPEPAGKGDVAADRIYTLTYPDGPHNAETLLVDPRSGDIEIVTKISDKPSSVFKLSRPGASGRYVLTKVGDLQVGSGFAMAKLVTGGDVSPDSKHVILRTYAEAWEYDISTSFDSWIRATPRHIQTNAEMQGEAICYSRNGEALLTSSEGSPCPISEARLDLLRHSAPAEVNFRAAP